MLLKVITIARIFIQIKSVTSMTRTSGAAIKTTSRHDNAQMITDVNFTAHIKVYARQCKS